MKKEIDKLPEGFLKHLAQTKNVIQEIELEEYKERFDTEEAIRNRMVTDLKNTQHNKERFINEIKHNLGPIIKINPGEVIHIKRPWYYKILKFFKRLIKTI